MRKQAVGADGESARYQGNRFQHGLDSRGPPATAAIVSGWHLHKVGSASAEPNRVAPQEETLVPVEDKGFFVFPKTSPGNGRVR